MILVGIDDTDVADSPGTNQVARSIVAELGDGFHCVRIVRHQLLFDPRVPYTSKNSCCSLLIQSRDAPEKSIDGLRSRLRELLLLRFQPGSDPGLCLAMQVPSAVVEFGKRCKTELTAQDEARGLASKYGLRLEALGGTEDGVIGAIAAVGLAATENDGRVVQIQQQPDDLSGTQSIALLNQRGVDRVVCDDAPVTAGTVDVGKHLRPNLRGGQVVLFVESNGSEIADWKALRKL